MNSKTKRQFRLCGTRNGARKRGEEHAQILIENLPGDTTQEEIKKMFERMRGNIYLDLRSDHGRQAKDKDGAWTRTCHANIRCSEVSAALKAKELYNGAILRRGHEVKITIKYLHDDVWFWINKNGEIDIYAINVSCYEFLSIVIEYDPNIYFVKYSKEFSSLKRMISDDQIIAIIPPSINNDEYSENNDLINYNLLCTFKRIDYAAISMELLLEKEIPQLLIYREVNILAQHRNTFEYLLPFGIDNDLSDMLLSMDIMDQLRDCNNECYRSSDNSSISVLCSQGPGGTFSHSKGGYINSYDFACSIGTPVIAPRDGIITDITDHHKKHGTDLVYEKKCNYVTILHDDGSQCDLVHLRYKSIAFQKGDYVKAGDLIAYSGNTGFSGEPHIHMMVYVNRLVHDEVHWQSVPIKFKIDQEMNPCTVSMSSADSMYPVPGKRYIQHVKSLYLDPLLIPSDRIACATDCHPAWSEMDYTPAPNAHSDIMIRDDINNVVYYTVADLSTLQSDLIIVPLSMKYIMNDWLSCRVMRRGGTKLMKELMKRGYDLLHTVGLKKSKQHDIKYDNVNKNIFVLSGYDQLPCKRVMFVASNAASAMKDIFEYLCANHDRVTEIISHSYVNQRRLNHVKIETIGIELPLFNTSDTTLIAKLERQLKGIRNGLIKYMDYVSRSANKELSMKQWYICAQSLHDLHCYSEYIAAWFPRRASISRKHCVYVAHCPCGECIARSYGLGKLNEEYKIELHQKGIDNDSCSGVEDKYLYLQNVYQAGESSPHKESPSPPPDNKIMMSVDEDEKECSSTSRSSSCESSSADDDINLCTNNNVKKRKRNQIDDNSDDDDITFISADSWSQQQRRKKKKQKKMDKNFDYHSKVRENIAQCLQNNNVDAQFLANETRASRESGSDHLFGSSHLMSLIAQQSQLDEQTQRCVIYQQFERWRFQMEGKNLSQLKEIQRAELGRLQMLRSMQHKQQIAFQKSKKNNEMIIAEKHGVVGSADHMNCIPVTPRFVAPIANKLSYMIQCVAPKQEYYQNTISAINLHEIGFAQKAIQELKNQQVAQRIEQQQRIQIQSLAIAEQRRKAIQIQQQLQAHALQQQQIRIQQQQQQQLQAASVNADNFTKIQNIINMLVKNKMAFCSAKITSSQHAIHHVTNCVTCMGTLERAKGTLFK